MKHFSDCINECATCAIDHGCLAGIGDNDWTLASEKQLIERLKSPQFQNRLDQQKIMDALNQHYSHCIAFNEKEDKSVTMNDVLHVHIEPGDLSNIAIPVPVEKDTRPSKTEYYLSIANNVAQRGTCLRRKYGAIIVKDDRIVSTGYAGAPHGRKNCCDIGTCLRQEYKIPAGERYELCRSVHAEMNAIIQASAEEMKGATLYLSGIDATSSEKLDTTECCSMCKRAIINAGIQTVVYDGEFPVEHEVQEWIDNDESLELHKGY